MVRASHPVLVALVLAFLAACDLPRARPPRLPAFESGGVLLDDQLSGCAEPDDDADDDADDDFESWFDCADELAGHRPVAYVKMRDWKPPRAEEELETELRARRR